MMSKGEEEKIPTSIAEQREEMESMAAKLADDFTLLSQGEQPISYSIHLRNDEFSKDASDIPLRLPDDLRLIISYPSTYPDNDIPTFDILYDKTNITLHEIQVRAILKTIITVAQENVEIGMPCVYSCVQAAKEFLSNGGLDQAGLALLSDDNLACILSYLATSKEDIDEICTTLPIVENAAKQNIVWKQLCRRRWKDKWGYKMRWERALENFTLQPDEHYWLDTYNNEEEDAKRTYLTLDELCKLSFDWRRWFRNQPENGLLTTALEMSFARDVVFTEDGHLSYRHAFIEGVTADWIANDRENITFLRLQNTQYNVPVTQGLRERSWAQLLVMRRINWGWELRDDFCILRAVAEETTLDELWEDLTSNIIVQERPKWLETTRSPYECNHREIPDDEDCKALRW